MVKFKYSNKQIKIRMWLLAGTIPAFKKLLAGTIPAFKSYWQVPKKIDFLTLFTSQKNFILSNFFELTLRLFLLFWKIPVYLGKIHANLQKVPTTLRKLGQGTYRST